MVRLAAIAVVLAGCDVVFGLRDVTSTDATIEPSLVTGHYKQIYVTNDASFAPLVSERIYPPGTISFAVTLDDETQPPVTYSADGSFTFPVNRAGQSYRLIVTADGSTGIIEQHAAQLSFIGALGGRPDRINTSQTIVQFPYPLSGAGTKPAMIYSTGLYTQTSTGEFGPMVSFDWRLAAPATGSTLGMLEAAKHDQIFTVEPIDDVTTIPTTPYTTIKGVAKASISQTPSATITLAQPMMVSRNACVRLVAPNAQEAARIMAAAPRAYVQSTFDWVVFMAPAPQMLGFIGSLWVAIASGSPAQDLDIAPTFHDPFTGMTPVIESGAGAVFSVQLPGATPLKFANINRRYMTAERGTPTNCTPPKTMLTPSIAIPTTMTLAGEPLDTDGKTIALDLSHDVELAWTTTEGPVDFYTVGVQELQIVNGNTTNIVRDSMGVAGQTTAHLASSLFEPGKSYIVNVQAWRGRPNVATGDWETFVMPFEIATVWSYYFQVQAR